MDANKDNRIAELGEFYSGNSKLRASVQLVPHIGSALDTLLTSKASKIRQERLESFLENLDKRLSEIEDAQLNSSSEELDNYLLEAIEHVTRASSDTKRQRFTNLIANQVAQPREWDEADMAMRMISDLADIHINVLLVSSTVPIAADPFNLPIVSLPPQRKPDGEAIEKTTLLTNLLPNEQLNSLWAACSELVAKGLLHDEGVGRMDCGANTHLLVTDTAHWLLGWIGARQIEPN